MEGGGRGGEFESSARVAPFPVEKIGVMWGRGLRGVVTCTFLVGLWTLKIPGHLDRNGILRLAQQVERIRYLY